jgi:hypothetical protein
MILFESQMLVFPLALALALALALELPRDG